MTDLFRSDVTPMWKPVKGERPAGAGKPKRPSEYRQRQMRKAKQGPCRICGAPPPSNLHHVIARSKGLVAWSESNLVPLCGSGTTGCHGKVEARNWEACRTLVMRLTDAEYAYVVNAAGEYYLERRYGIVYKRAAA